MFTTSDENGVLNNFAKEPKLYYAQYPSQKEQRGYLLQGIFGILLVGTVVATAFLVS